MTAAYSASKFALVGLTQASALDLAPQQVMEVDHTYGPEELVAAGRDTQLHLVQVDLAVVRDLVVERLPLKGVLTELSDAGSLAALAHSVAADRGRAAA